MNQARLIAIRDRAKRLHAEGRLVDALAAHDEALRLAPDAVGIRVSAATLAHTLGLPNVSLEHFERAAQVDPGCYPALDAARRIAVAAGLSERAVRYSAQAQALRPNPEILASMSLAVPAVAASLEDIAATRARYERALDALLASPMRLDAPEGALGSTQFFLAYHGECDRELQIKAAHVFQRMIPSLSMTAPHCRGGTRRAGRLRIGFISRHFYRHSIGSTSRGLIDKLSREVFEVYALRITPSGDDDITAKIRASADRTVDLAAEFHRAREQIAALELDILFYQDVGMEPMSYFLAFARLAPVQCVSFGHPNTTGIPTMDYFVSNDLFERDGAAADYSERLYLLHDLPTLAYYYRPARNAQTAARAAFDLPDGVPLYVCPQTLFKLHPDFDRLLQAILARDPDGLIVLIAGQFEEFTATLRERFARGVPQAQSRIRFLPRLPFERYLQLLELAHVVLDSVHFNGMNSSLECFAMGTPIVTLPTRLQRGRHTQAMYRAMAILDCIAADAADYAQIAVRIATDPARRQALRERILAANHVLFENERVVAEFERFFVEAAAGATALVSNTSP